MFSTELLTGFAVALSVVALLCAGAAVIISWRSSRNIAQVALWVHNNNSKSVTLKRMAEVESTLTDLTDSYNSLLTAHKKLRSRIGMRESRRKANEKPEDLAAIDDKAELRHKARAAGMLR